ncbi:MAG: hypothetical protein M0038_17320 [Pseudomonadota bacterium]|jgi:hypothetical protein|nr:hypothetical protein [Pseudomonadota bacterium]
MRKIVIVVVLLAFSAISAYHAIWAREIRDRQLIKLERFHEKDSRMLRFSRKLMGASYVFSFRLIGSVGALVLLVLAIYVVIHG